MFKDMRACLLHLGVKLPRVESLQTDTARPFLVKPHIRPEVIACKGRPSITATDSQAMVIPRVSSGAGAGPASLPQPGHGHTSRVLRCRGRPSITATARPW